MMSATSSYSIRDDAHGRVYRVTDCGSYRDGHHNVCMLNSLSHGIASNGQPYKAALARYDFAALVAALRKPNPRNPHELLRVVVDEDGEDASILQDPSDPSKGAIVHPVIEQLCSDCRVRLEVYIIDFDGSVERYALAWSHQTPGLPRSPPPCVRILLDVNRNHYVHVDNIARAGEDARLERDAALARQLADEEEAAAARRARKEVEARALARAKVLQEQKDHAVALALNEKFMQEEQDWQLAEDIELCGSVALRAIPTF